jgi:hypothetical protein
MIAQSFRKKISEDSLSAPSRKRRKLLSSLLRISSSGEVQDLMLQKQGDNPHVVLQNDQSDVTHAALDMESSQFQADMRDEDEDDDGAEKPIPKPDNITVTLFSWTPPSIRVGWDFPDPYLVIPASTPFPNYPVPSSSSTTETPIPSSESASSVKNEQQHRKLRLEAFRIIYHPTVTK